MAVKVITNKIEYEMGKKIELEDGLLPDGVSVHEVEITYWPNYKPRGRSATNNGGL